MRVIALVVLMLAIATGGWFLIGATPGASAAMGQTSLYDGTGETNLDLASPDNILYLDLKDGRVVIQMRPDLAPKHVQRIKELVRKGHYDGLSFHRVIEGFMAQGGDPAGTGAGGTGVKIPAEFSSHTFVRGVVGMARSRDENSADSQFYIMLGKGTWLNGKYTVWGEVIEGMEHVDAIKKGDKNMNGKMTGEPDKILHMQIKADAK